MRFIVGPHHPSDRVTAGLPRFSDVLEFLRKKGHQGCATMAQKLFVGGLAFSTSNDRLREVFAECGQVESAVVVTDRDTGRSRGFGFVEMATPEEADQAINKFNGQEVDGRRLQVEKAKEPGSGGGGGGGGRGGFGGPRRSSGGGGGGRSGGGGGGGRW
jgi:cold-inducible RNA-binding protein